MINKYEGRGKDPLERGKTRKIVCRQIYPNFANSDLAKLVSSASISNFDIAKDAMLWQQSIQAFWNHLQAYDMSAIMKIPDSFDLLSGSSILAARHFHNIVIDHKTIDEDTCRKWQEWLYAYGLFEDVESNNWMMSILELSMSKTLRAAVLSDIESLPEIQRGAITTWYFLVKRVVLRNQEGKDLLVEYINSFDIRNYNNQAVDEAVLFIKAVIRALDANDLPSNLVRKILTGMSHASNASFKELCVTTLALQSSSVYKKLYSHLSSVAELNMHLSDLEAKYSELTGGKTWDGTGFEAATFKASTSLPQHLCLHAC